MHSEPSDADALQSEYLPTTQTSPCSLLHPLFATVDGYTNPTGFPLKYADQIAYNKFLADTAHSMGLAAGLKNDVDQLGDLVASFDFAINEQCNMYSECGTYAPFKAGEFGMGAWCVSLCRFLPVDVCCVGLDTG